MVQQQLKAGIKASERAESLWPGLERARELLQGGEEKRKGAGKGLQLFREYDTCQRKSLQLLQRSHEHIQIILEKLCGQNGAGAGEVEPERGKGRS
jgi:hypothetical protein